MQPGQDNISLERMIPPLGRIITSMDRIMHSWAWDAKQGVYALGTHHACLQDMFSKHNLQVTSLSTELYAGYSDASACCRGHGPPFGGPQGQCAAASGVLTQGGSLRKPNRLPGPHSNKIAMPVTQQ